MELTKGRVHVELLPSPSKALRIIKERHEFAIEAQSTGLSAERAKQLAELSSRQEKEIGRRALVVLSAEHAKYIEITDDESEVFESTLHGFAIAMTTPYKNQDEFVLAWWRSFSGEISDLVHGTVREWL